MLPSIAGSPARQTRGATQQCALTGTKISLAKGRGTCRTSGEDLQGAQRSDSEALLLLLPSHPFSTKSRAACAHLPQAPRHATPLTGNLRNQSSASCRDAKGWNRRAPPGEGGGSSEVSTFKGKQEEKEEQVRLRRVVVLGQKRATISHFL